MRAEENNNKVALVTGAASGIGRAVAEALVARGGVSVVLLDLDIVKLTDVKQEISSDAKRVHAYQLDISNADEVDLVIQKISTEVGAPSMVCNSAAIQQYGRVESTSNADWQRLIDVNLNGTFYMCKATLPLLVETSGRLLNIASLAGKIGLPYDAAYSASKGAVIAMTKALAKEFSDRDVCINAIAPGAVDTPMYATAIPEGINPDVLKVIPRSARPMADAEEIAALVVFLLTDAPKPLTGSIISIDGASN